MGCKALPLIVSQLIFKCIYIVYTIANLHSVEGLRLYLVDLYQCKESVAILAQAKYLHCLVCGHEVFLSEIATASWFGLAY